MGLFIFNAMGEEVLSHGGGANGINTYSLYLPSKNIVVVTGTNVPQDAADFAFSIVGCLTGTNCQSFRDVEIPKDIQNAVLGTYAFDNGKKEKLFLSSGSLFMQYENQRPLKVLYAGDNTYFIKRRRHWFTISESRDGQTLLSFHERGSPSADIAIKE